MDLFWLYRQLKLNSRCEKSMIINNWMAIYRSAVLQFSPNTNVFLLQVIQLLRVLIWFHYVSISFSFCLVSHLNDWCFDEFLHHPSSNLKLCCLWQCQNLIVKITFDGVLSAFIHGICPEILTLAITLQFLHQFSWNFQVISLMTTDHIDSIIFRWSSY